MPKKRSNTSIFKLTDMRQVRPIIFREKPTAAVVVGELIENFSLNGCIYQFSTPNNISIFVSLASRELKSAHKLYDSLIGTKIKTGTTVLKFEGKNLKKLFDYLEHIQASIVALYTAIEALANVAIPVDFRLEIKNDKGVTELWDKTAIERWRKTSEKIGSIVPKILNIQSPKELLVWAGFMQLEDIRNKIIHQKTTNSQTDKVDSSFLRKLLDPKVFDHIDAGFSLIKYFCLKDAKHTFFPLGFAPAYSKAIEVDDIDRVLKVIPGAFE